MKKPDMKSISNMGSNMTLSNLLGWWGISWWCPSSNRPGRLLTKWSSSGPR
jgi:hypothetical protein